MKTNNALLLVQNVRKKGRNAINSSILDGVIAWHTVNPALNQYPSGIAQSRGVPNLSGKGTGTTFAQYPRTVSHQRWQPIR